MYRVNFDPTNIKMSDTSFLHGMDASQRRSQTEGEVK